MPTETQYREDEAVPAELPIPISFRLPEGWHPVSPDDVGSPGAAFVALNVATVGSGFTANITLEGEYRPDDATLTQLADASLRQIAEGTTACRLLDREEVGGPDAPGLTQFVGMTATVNDTEQQVIQAEFYLSLHDVDDPRERVVLRTVLTATEAQFPELVDDYQSFVGSLEPDGGE
ncbi:hypothetical protein [Amycolatopsis suaedae]|uniref:DUF1795 domain-containing protein n=1 Tax=Amycolatopsis suaedae TaxID=2510978 RepID=A0A4Q7J244_9PSEU|nr:hypothetical protein [Amycolatopsis suaedae]RZQ60947.1 hypothetical protein EWH70_26020 [Amycolatopsis suaedae]